MLDMRYQLSSVISYHIYHPLRTSACTYHIIPGCFDRLQIIQLVFEAFRRYPPEKFIALVESHGIKCPGSVG